MSTPGGRWRAPLGIPSVDEDTRKAALEEAGPSWKEWFYLSFARVWILLGLFNVDAILVATWLNPFQPGPLALSLVVALYLEFLLYQFLWHQPDPEKEYLHPDFHPTWRRPVRFGRWTPMAMRVRRGQAPYVGQAHGPDPSEFL
jgi:hypothetical protein